jgi:hypothetical protein
MSNISGKIGEIGKAINHFEGMIDSFNDLLPNGILKNIIIKYTGNVNQAYLQQQSSMRYDNEEEREVILRKKDQ